MYLGSSINILIHRLAYYLLWGVQSNSIVILRLLDMAHEKEIPKADVYAISACTPNYPELLRVAQEIKDLHNGTVIVGGPHFDAIFFKNMGKRNRKYTQ